MNFNSSFFSSPRSIFEQPQTAVNVPVPPVTKEAVVQTFARSNRGLVLNRIDEGVCVKMLVNSL